MEKKIGIDIVIPIYNAYEDLQKCIASIFAHTDLNRHRLLLINDASTDERIASYLRSLMLPNILYIENPKNYGFSESINRGIIESKERDVILLNSDTQVTSGWVEKMIKCAYSEPSISTVTPLSNNATLCSVPLFLEENQLPEGYSLDEYAALIEMVSLCEYPRIPVANGFCMYIKRDIIDIVGLFDSKTFGRGYGEENDFCYRCEQLGYHHVMCDNTYIYHTGTASFVSEEKRQYIEAHEKILNERYLGLNRAVAIHCQENPNAKIQENIKLWTGLLNGRKNVLYLVQSDFRSDADDHHGGTQLHVKDMVSCMRNTYNVFVVARNRDYLNLTAYTQDSEYLFKFYVGPVPEYPELRSKKFAQRYGKILDAFSIDLVHIHHTKDVTLELYYESYERDIPIIATLHDYYIICPRIKMVNCYHRLCLMSPEEQCCQQCINSLFSVSSNTNYLSFWREEHRKVLTFAKKLVTPSVSSKDIILSFYPELRGKLMVVPHGVASMKRNATNSSSQLHVAFLGGVSKEKGQEASWQMIKKGPKTVQWYLFGVWGYNDLSMNNRRNYTKTGLYERDELPELMEKYQIDLVCILSIWPETYSYTLSEAIMYGVPAIVTDIGALGERMREMNCGWIVSTEHTYEEALKIIERIKDKGDEYQEKKAIVSNTHIKTLDEMRDDYLGIYAPILFLSRDRIELTLELKKHVINAHLMAMGKRWCLEGNSDEVQEQVRLLQQDLYQIKNSFAYKCTRFLVGVPIPGKKHIKKGLYMVYKNLSQK